VKEKKQAFADFLGVGAALAKVVGRCCIPTTTLTHFSGRGLLRIDALTGITAASARAAVRRTRNPIESVKFAEPNLDKAVKKAAANVAAALKNGKPVSGG
jgi:hypothetical protein